MKVRYEDIAIWVFGGVYLAIGLSFDILSIITIGCFFLGAAVIMFVR
jgi:hypothetical protein